ncbi:MAG: hypothetical protein ACKVI3_07860, partial [Verrucomicrobiia bacterium]
SADKIEAAPPKMTNEAKKHRNFERIMEAILIEPWAFGKSAARCLSLSRRLNLNDSDGWTL